jgi:hypothetical protein
LASAIVSGDVFAPGEVGDVDLDGRLERIDADLAVAAEGDGADVAGRDAVGFDQVDDAGAQLFEGELDRHAIDLG